MKYQDCFLFKPNLTHIPIADFDGNAYVGRMALYAPQSDNYEGLRLGGRNAKVGDIMLIRLWDSPYQKDSRGHFKVGPVGSVNPRDFRDSVSCDNVFILPEKKKELIEEYNTLCEAAEMLDSRIAWMDALEKEDFSENEYRLDEIMEKINVELTDDKDTIVRELLKNNIKI
jgi:hypothetical protein